MNKSEIFKLMNENPVFYLATEEGDQPHVRGMLLYRADEQGIIFHTATSKDLYAQVKANPQAELCFNAKGLQIRVTGKLEEVNDPELEKEIYAHPSRKFLRDWGDMGPDCRLAIYKLEHGTASTWTMTTNFDKKVYIQL